MNTARSKGQGEKKNPPLSGTFERSHGIFHNQREIKTSRSNQFFPRNVSRNIEISYVSTFLTFLTHLFLGMGKL